MVNQPQARTARKKRSRLLGAYYSSFLLLGMVAAVLGPSLIKLADQLGSNLAGVSVFFPVRAGSYLFGSWLAGQLFDRYKGHALLAGALSFMGAALVLVPIIPEREVMIGVLVVMGLSMGLLDVGCNTLLLWAVEDRPGPFLNGLHFFYGLGSLIAPIFLALAFQRQQGVSLGYWLTAALILPVLLQLVGLPSPAPDQDPGGGNPEGRSHPASFKGDWDSRILLLSIFLFFYVGVEVGYGGWLYTYGLKLNLETEVSGAYLTSVFWGTFTLGRLLSVPLSDRISPRKMLAADLAVGAGGLLILALAPPGRWVIRIMTVVLGLALASVFPSTLALAGEGRALSARASSWFFVSGGLGAVSLPWVIGLLISETGPAAFPIVLLSSFSAGIGVFVFYLAKHKLSGCGRDPS